MNQKERERDTPRAKCAVVDGDGNLVVTIVKYSWLTCLFHSFYSFLLLALLVGVVLSVVEQWWIVAVALFVFGIFIWMQIWVDANDKLKKRIYPKLFIEHFDGESVEMKSIVRFDQHTDLLLVVPPSGEIKSHKVEFIMEDLPLYMVKIHSRGENV